MQARLIPKLGKSKAGIAFGRKFPLSDQIHADLRRRILALELPPDTSLSRSELSDHYGVSQTPLRDATLKLEAEGLLEIYPQSKTVVTRIDTTSVHETQFLRKAVEVEIADVLAREPDKSVLAPAEEANERLQWSARRRGDFDEFNALDKLFHRALYAAVEKTGLFELIDQRSGQLDRIRRLHLQLKDAGKPAQVVADHARVLAAIRASDAAGARCAMQDHLSGTLQKLEELKARFPAYFD